MTESSDHVQDHVDVIARHEQEFHESRTRSERVGDAIAGIVGSLPFVGVHLCIFALWIILNTVRIGTIPHIDPAPFSLLATCFALEGILLASFILMRQARMGRRAEERDQLVLQILLLTEKEITAVLGIERQIAERLGLQSVAKDKNFEQLSQHTSIDDVAQTIKERLPKPK